MKKIFLIIFLLAGIVQAQTFGDSDFYGNVTSVSDASTFQLRQSNQTKTITWATMGSLLGSGSTITSSDNTWSAANDFTSTLQVPSSLSATLSRGIGFNSGLFSWVESGSIKTGADRSWVLEQMADSGIAVDTNAFLTKAGYNDITGNNLFRAQLAVGSSTNNGELKIPVYTGSTKPTEVDGSIFNIGSKIRLYNGSEWYTYLDSASTVSLLQTGTFLPASGTLSGISSDLSFSSGGIEYKTNAFGNVNMLGASSTPSSSYYKNGLLYSNSVATGEVSLKILHQLQDDSWSTTTLIGELAIDDKLEDVLTANAVSYETQVSSDSVDFENTNTIHSYLEDDGGGVTLYPKNYGSGISQQIVVYGQGEPTISFGSITLLYESDVALTDMGTGYYRIWFTYLTSTKCLVDWGFYE